MSLRLSKLHATGNDFLVVQQHEHVVTSRDALSVSVSATHREVGSIARALCDRRRGIGADGLIVVRDPGLPRPGLPRADCSMVLWNADGGRAEMSGNGIRCLAWVAVRDGLAHDNRLVVDTDAGRRELELVTRAKGGALEFATVDMGPVTFEPEQIPLDAPSAFDLAVTYHGTEYHGDAAGMGNPHLVLLVDDVATARVAQHGPHFEHDERFPLRTNVEFIAATGSDGVDMRVWERGVGETLSCGTGACAAAAVAHRRGLVGERSTVRVPGGELVVELGDTIRLGGPVVHVFDVDIDPSALTRDLA